METKEKVIILYPNRKYLPGSISGKIADYYFNYIGTDSESITVDIFNVSTASEYYRNLATDNDYTANAVCVICFINRNNPIKSYDDIWFFEPDEIVSVRQS